ncbi:glycine-rich domain-containing protein, partial [Kluyvera ascorbata]
IFLNVGLTESAFGLQNLVVFDTAGVTNWNVPDVLKKGRKCKITVIGGGGSGGRAEGGGGGGGGGIAEKFVDLTGIQSVSITIGKGGVAPAAGTGSTSGTPGGASSFGVYLSATGGYAGTTPSAGRAGTGVGGDYNSSLGSGSPGAAYGPQSFCSGSGGGPGGYGAVSTSRADGADGMGPGGGGSGAAAGSQLVSCRAGSGMDGIVIVEW